MDSLILTDFPMPPSVNTMLMPVMGALRRNKAGKVYGAGRMVKSKEHILYSKLCDQWAIKYRSGLERFKNELREAKAKAEFGKQPFCLDVSAHYMFHVEHLFTVNNKIQPKDADNLNKAAGDNLCRIIGIDDKHIFKFTAEKGITAGHECAIIKIGLYKPRSRDEIMYSIL